MSITFVIYIIVGSIALLMSFYMASTGNVYLAYIPGFIAALCLAMGVLTYQEDNRTQYPQI